ncbi:phage holin family protein [Hansschlegelia zhihuaiae]|uniref:Phage holin family protein n=1 Tax=Hansschlegelia zhihuaiae TaxID=405005 RepID=A0A4Q0MEV3_9HYPH|nr:phage holin family protein [Hansschlegelia zhihuaiae]RXF72001.1 hypothetical protein EK403_14345 [Hansschlegelia zhihuaiae]
MWRLLLQAGLGFATFDASRRIARLKRMAVYCAVAGVLGLIGLGALAAALAIWLEPRFGAAGAAAIVGGGLLVLAGLIGWIGTWKPAPAKAPSPIFNRVRAEVGAAGAALSEARSARAARAARPAAADLASGLGEPLPPRPGARRKRAVNLMLIATLAGVVLGRRL